MLAQTCFLSLWWEQLSAPYFAVMSQQMSLQMSLEMSLRMSLQMYFIRQIYVTTLYFAVLTAESCDTGHFFTAGKCEVCPIGEYNSKRGQSSCTACPDKKTTLTSGRSSVQDCYREFCPFQTCLKTAFEIYLHSLFCNYNRNNWNPSIRSLLQSHPCPMME